jgi:hypothetical protein
LFHKLNDKDERAPGKGVAEMRAGSVDKSMKAVPGADPSCAPVSQIPFLAESAATPVGEE